MEDKNIWNLLDLKETHLNTSPGDCKWSAKLFTKVRTFMKEILKNLDIDTIIPHGGGIESAAAVAWAKRLGLNPLIKS